MAGCGGAGRTVGGRIWRTCVWTALAFVLVICGCDRSQLQEHQEILGSWEYDMARTIRGFAQLRGSTATLGQVGPVQQMSSAFAEQARKDGFRTTLVIYPRRIEVKSPLGTQELEYSVVSKEGGMYTLLATGMDGGQREVRIRRLPDIDAIAFMSRDCRELPVGCQLIKTAIAQELGISLPEGDHLDVGLPSTNIAATTDANECDKQPCAESDDALKPLLPRWLYYVRVREGGEQV